MFSAKLAEQQTKEISTYRPSNKVQVTKTDFIIWQAQKATSRSAEIREEVEKLFHSDIAKPSFSNKGH